MNQREKEEYLREYAILKSKGKPFFPYAVAKDSVMMVVVMAVIITMSIVLGAELGPKADPTTTTYVPRPEWYFFFLFEVLRVIKPPELVPFATIGVPTICMIMLFLLPFIDRGPERRPERRPIATIAGILVIVRDGLPDLHGRGRRLAELDRHESSPANLEKGKLVAAQSGCLACHKIGENGNDGPGPHLTRHRRQAREGRDPPHAREPDRADAVLRATCPRTRRPRSSTSSRRSRAGAESRLAGRVWRPVPARCPPIPCGRCSTVSPASMTS